MSALMEDPIIKHSQMTTGAEPNMPQVGNTKLSPYRLFPGYDNIPFRLPRGNQPLNLKQDDPEHMQPKPVADAYAKVFNLSTKKDLEEYNEVWDKAAKGTVLISREELQWSEKEQTFLAFLRWGELYLELPKEGLDAHRTFSS